MRIFTTPDLRIRILKKDGTVATDLEFEYLIFTLRSCCARLDKRVDASEVEEGVFTVTLTQEETGLFPGYDTVKAELNFFNGNKRLGTLIKTISTDDNLIDEVM